KEIEVTGSVDTKKAGTYKVTYNYRDIKKVATIIVEANVTAKDVVVKDSKIDVGSKWDAKDNFEYVLMSNGSKLSWSDVSKEIEVTGSVDTKKAGTYKVTYTYRDIKKVATVTVKKQNEVTAKKLVVRDTKIFVDSKWNVKDNFNYVLMSDGSKLLWKDVEREITVDGKVNTQKAGTYKITYKFRGLTNVAKITVEEVKAKSLILKDTTLVVGSKWNAKDNFEYVLMNNGTKLSWTDVEKEILIFGEVNTQKAGTYKVTYECRDLKKVATITVKQSGKPVSGTSVGNKPTASKPVTTKPVKPLPQTSETNNSELLIIGILMISGVFILVSFKLRKETN
ncbi:bacterial Ig-like domain-containing protein, partial [Vagococcus carniphilus]